MLKCLQSLKVVFPSWLLAKLNPQALSPMESKFKSLATSFVSSVSDYFEINVEVRLFGVRVFQFTWPPKKESSNPENL